MNGGERDANSDSPSPATILLLGYGNPGRQDDGLGPAAAAAIANCFPGEVRVECNYQLNIEDAADAAEFERVVFVDAAEAGPEPFELREIFSAEASSFTSHVVRPETILAITSRVYGRTPRAWLLAIRGYEFELHEELTLHARQNLDEALVKLRSIISEWKNTP